MLSKDILEEIDSVFPPLAMPPSHHLTVHDDDCDECEEIRKHLGWSRDNNEDMDDVIRYLHNRQRKLSPEATLWLLPFYLKYSLSEMMSKWEEINYLVISLSPLPDDESETYFRLSLLNSDQVMCLIHFVEWVASNDNWQELHDDAVKAKQFLQRHPALTTT